MSALLEIAISNVFVATLLAIVVLSVSRFIRRPALVHFLWIVVLLKLVAPPVFRMDVIDWPVTETDLTSEPAPNAVAPAVVDSGVAATPLNFNETNPIDSIDMEDSTASLAVNEETPVLAEETAAALDSMDVPQPAIDPLKLDSNEDGEATLEATGQPFPFESVGRPLLLAWLVGSVAVVLLVILRVVRFRRLLKTARPAPTWLRAEVGELCDEIGLRRAPETLLISGVVSPMLWAFGRRARVILPAELLSQLDQEQRRTVLLHELCHLRRGDSWVRLLELVAGCFYWWNPLVWLARREIQKAEEECCDAWVVSRSTSGRSYAEALLATVDFLSTPPKPSLPPAASGIGNVRFLRRRLTMIMEGTTPSRLSTAGRVGVILLALCLLPLWPAIGQQQDGDKVESDTSTNSEKADSPKSDSPVKTPKSTVRSVEPTTFETSSTVLESGPDTESLAVLAVAQSPTGQVLAASYENGTVLLRRAATNDILHTLKSHGDVVGSIVFSPNGKMLATASYDKTIKLWDVETGKELKELTGHTNWVFSAAISPDGKLLVSGSYDKTVRLWDISSGKQIAKFDGHTATVRSVSFSPDGKLIASGSGDRTLRVWDVESRSEIAKFAGHKGSIRAIAFSPDGKSIASGSEDNLIKIWDVATKSERRELAGHSDMVWSIAFSPNGKTIASGSFDNSIRIWDVETGQSRQRLTGHSDVVTSLAFAADMSGLISGSYDKSLRLWKSKQPPAREIVTLAAAPEGLRVCSYSPNGLFLLTASHDAMAKIWDLSTGKAVRLLRGHSGGIRTGTWSRDGKLVATAGWDNSIRIWNAETGATIGVLADGQHDVMMIDFTPDGKQLVSGGRDKTAKVWDVESFELLHTTAEHAGPLVAAEVSPDGKSFVTASGDYKNSNAAGDVKMFEVATGKLLREFKGHTKGAISAHFSPDGKQILTTSYDETRLWDAATGKQIRTIGPAGASCASFFAGGKTIVTGRYRGLAMWDVETGKEIKTFTGLPGTTYKVNVSPDQTVLVTAGQDGAARFWPTGVHPDGTSLPLATKIKAMWPVSRSVPRLVSDIKKDLQEGVVNRTVISPDGKYLALCGDKKTVRIVNAATGEHFRTIAGHNDTIRDCAFSPDSKMIATVFKNNVRLFRVDNGGTIGIVTRLENVVACVRFTPDGERLITGDVSGTINIWDVRTRRQLVTMSRMENGELTCMAVSPDGRLLATGDTSKSVTLWDLTSHERITTFSRHKDRVTAVAFSPDGRTLVTGAHAEKSDTSALMVWDVATRALRPSYQVAMTSIKSISFSPNGQTYATVATDRVIRLWDTATSHLLATVPSRHDEEVNDLMWSADGNQLVSASTDGVVTNWDVGETGASWVRGFTTISQDPMTATFRKTLAKHGKTARVAIFSPDGRYIATGGTSKQLQIFDAKSLELIRSIESGENYITSAAFMTNSTKIALGGTSKNARVFDIETGERLVEFTEPNSVIRKVFVSPNDADVIACAYEDGNVYIWNAATGKIKRTIPAGMHVVAIAVSPDGKLLATGSQLTSDRKYGPIHIWDYETGQKIKTLPRTGGNILGLTFLEDGQRLVAANAGAVGVTVWDVPAGRMIRSLHRRPDVQDVRLRNGTTQFATAHGNGPGMAGLWDAQTGRRLCYFKAHGPVMWMTEVSPDGKTMITAATDGEVKVWSLGKP